MERTLIATVPQQVGQAVMIQGWVIGRRDHGKLLFFDLRDRSGALQAVVVPTCPDYATAQAIRDQFVVQLTGVVQARPAPMVNPELATGAVELLVNGMEILSTAQNPPFALDETASIKEDLRLKYRYLDLRSERMQRNLRLRSRFVQTARAWLFERDFVEIETPLLTKSTAEGSRDFVVPSRLQPGAFYALPQSPQQYKQLLMVAGFERYFQIARCLRDEDLRADRGFEHTQIDLEMSFVNREAVMALVEALMTHTVEQLGFTIKEKPFPRFSYAEALAKFGADKFDLRTEADKAGGILAYAWVVDFPFFERDDRGGWTFTHNPFSLPLPASIDDHLAGRKIDQILTSQYDLVCNGFEAAGGSIRAHQPELLQATYRIMGYSPEQTRAAVGHMLDAFGYGAPPHGGIAIGVERNLMNLAHEQYLREVQAFPTTASGHTAVMAAPSPLPHEQLHELGLALRPKR